MDLHLSLDGPGTLRRRLERELREAIQSGRLPRGARLPSSRDLAQELGVSRGVVTDAYSQLVAEGNLAARRGGGTRVSDSAESPASSYPASRTSARPATRDRIEYDLRPGLPDASRVPTPGLARGVKSSPARPAGRRSRVRQPTGIHAPALEPLGVSRPSPRGALRRGAHRPVLGYDPRAHAHRPGAPARRARRVAMEDPGWPAHRSSLTAADLEPVPVPVDDQGIRVDLLDALDVAAVIVTPAHQYPTGAVLSPDRRNGLVAWAHARSALIIEDDYDAEYRYGTEPVSCLQGMSPDHVIYAGTASKTLSPALRLAWLVLPEHLVNLVLDERTLAGPAPPPLIEAVVADLMDSGEWDRHLRRTRRSYRARRDVLVQGVAQHVPGIRVTGAAAGLHLLAWLPEGISEVDVAASAASAGIALGTLHRDCDVQAPRPPALLLGYAASPEPALLRAMERLGPCVARAARVMRADAAAVVRLRAMPRQTWCGRSPT